jgi:hypothetical protein
LDEIDQVNESSKKLSAKFIPFSPIQSLNFMGMAKRNILSKQIRKESYDMEKDIGKHLEKKEVLNFIKQDFCNP